MKKKNQSPLAIALMLFVFALLFLPLGIWFLSVKISDISEFSWIFIALSVLCLIVGIIFIVIDREQMKEQKAYEERIAKSNIYEIDMMSGTEFETFLASIYKKRGYYVEKTRASGDYGVDLILQSKDGQRTIIQTKRYSKKVSLSAVQEISAARDYYGIYSACVITNNYFTKSAIELAEANDVKLIDRDQLIKIITDTSYSEAAYCNQKND